MPNADAPAPGLSPPPLQPAADSADHPVPGGPTAVVVDDHEAVRGWVVTLLQGEGFTVAAAVGTLREGFEAIVRERPLVAIIDKLMPDGDGADLCARVRRVTPEPKLVLHTGAIMPVDERRAFAAGADAVVLKSVRCEELMRTVREFAGSTG